MRNYKLNVRKNYLGCRFTYVTTTEDANEVPVVGSLWSVETATTNDAEEDPVVGVPTDH